MGDGGQREAAGRGFKVSILFIIYAILSIYAVEAAYRNGATDGYGYSREPNNPGYRKAGEFLRKRMAYRWRELAAPPQADAPPQPCNHKTQAEADACREKHILEAMGEADAPQGEK